MAVYTNQIQSALRLIKAKGAKVSWLQTATTNETETPWIKEKAATTEFPVVIAFLPASSLLSKLFAGTNVAKGGYRGLMATVVNVVSTDGLTTGFVPTDADTVMRDGKALGLESVDVLNVNGEIILWKLEFKA